MSIVQALADKHGGGEIVRMPMKEIDKSCCTESELEVYDFDKYAHSLGGVNPKTMDGVWAGELRAKDHLALIEMKSLKNVAREFHFGECAKVDRGDDHEETVSNCQAAFKEFVDQKIVEWDFDGKMHGTQGLLIEIEPGLLQAIQAGEVVERCFIACDLPYRDFIRYRDTFKAVLRPLASEAWGEPAAVTCSWFDNEQTLRDRVSAG